GEELTMAADSIGVEHRAGAHFLCSRFIPFLVGGVLLAAAILKAQRLLTEPAAGTGLLESTWFQAVLVEVEVACGLALWFGLWPAVTRWASLTLFAAFLGAALSRALTGARSCACFGAVEFSPWLAAFLDIGLFTALICYRPCP